MKDIKQKKARVKKELTRKMELLLEGERDDDNIMDMINAKIQLSLEIDKDELFWEHKARANWLRFGDKNTTFFHNFAS